MFTICFHSVRLPVILAHIATKQRCTQYIFIDNFINFEILCPETDKINIDQIQNKRAMSKNLMSKGALTHKSLGHTGINQSIKSARFSKICRSR